MTTATETAKPEIEVGTATPELSPAERYAKMVKGALAKFDPNKLEVDRAIKTLGEITVIDQGGRDKAYEMVSVANKNRILIGKLREAAVKPWNDLVASINAYCKTDMTEPLAKAISAAEAKILAFDREEQRKRDEELARIAKEKAEALRKQQAEERARQEAVAAEQKRIDDEARAAREKAAENLKGIARAKAIKEAEEKAAADKLAAEEKAAQAETTARIDASLERADLLNRAEDLESVKVKGLKEEWDFEVTDINLVPDAYIKKEILRAVTLTAVKAGTRDIPGLRIFVKESLTKR